ncbi:hypothetical protein GCM10011586_27460 [Silvibacterium dinghuense]|nr:hypothetical protein GCM10011586_27460 [Silvibacterium dinghuense]
MTDPGALAGAKKRGCEITVTCATSPVPQICVVASNVLERYQRDRKVTWVQWA